MLHLLAICAFLAILVALTVVLEETIRGSKAEMLDALFGRPMARHRVSRSAAVTLSVPRSRRPRRAAAA
jgi:hypothetical protein